MGRLALGVALFKEGGEVSHHQPEQRHTRPCQPKVGWVMAHHQVIAYLPVSWASRRQWEPPGGKAFSKSDLGRQALYPAESGSGSEGAPSVQWCAAWSSSLSFPHLWHGDNRDPNVQVLQAFLWGLNELTHTLQSAGMLWAHNKCSVIVSSFSRALEVSCVQGEGKRGVKEITCSSMNLISFPRSAKFFAYNNQTKIFSPWFCPTGK